MNLTAGGSIPAGCELYAKDIKAQLAEDGDESPDEAESIVGFIMERDYELGTAIRDNIIPYAVRWFTGEACIDDVAESDDEDRADNGVDDAEDDDDESDDEVPKTKRKTKAPAKDAQIKGASGSGKKDEDCKQQ